MSNDTDRLFIRDLQSQDQQQIETIARFLLECFRQYSPDWLADETAARKQVEQSFESGRCSRVMLNQTETPVGWIGAFANAHTWEIHPIAIAPGHQGRGLGTQLVRDIEALARQQGAVSVWAGASDETGSTSFSDIDLYKSPASAFTNISAPADHPITFWKRIGYSVVGVIPDEEGLGKPGVHFARRLSQ